MKHHDATSSAAAEKLRTANVHIYSSPVSQLNTQVVHMYFTIKIPFVIHYFLFDLE